MTDWPHGGNLQQAMARHGGAVGDWLDLSTGINPLGWPVPPLPQAAFEPLPRRDGLESLCAAARAAYGVHDHNSIAAGAGAQSIIHLLPHLSPGSDVRILNPTYSAYGTALSRSFEVTHVCEAAGLAGADLAILANPNNPDGRDIGPDDLRALAGKVRLLVVDEAFRDMQPDRSLVISPLPDNLLALRSFGKFFGLAGLRLGFAMGSASLIDRIADLLGPWPVSGPALTVGAQALQDNVWIGATRQHARHDCDRLADLLRAAGHEIVANTGLFVTMASPDAVVIARRLGDAHIWVRAFDYAPTWLRIGLPGAEADWQRLEEALRA